MRKPPREVVITVVAVEAVAAAFAFRDLARRTDDQVRGPKLLWRGVNRVHPRESPAHWGLRGRPPPPPAAPGSQCAVTRGPSPPAAPAPVSFRMSRPAMAPRRSAHRVRD